eukprot:1619667-Pyramimonas_sp.AAC.1
MGATECFSATECTVVTHVAQALVGAVAEYNVSRRSGTLSKRAARSLMNSATPPPGRKARAAASKPQRAPSGHDHDMS